jgi:hypothetical protein
MNTTKRRDEFVTRELREHIEKATKETSLVGKDKDKLVKII